MARSNLILKHFGRFIFQELLKQKSLYFLDISNTLAMIMNKHKRSRLTADLLVNMAQIGLAAVCSYICFIETTC